MKTLVKTHWVRLCILALLLVLAGTLPSVHAACSSKVDAAVAQLQESARAENSVEDWLAQIVNETSTFLDLRSAFAIGTGITKITGTKIAQKKLWAALFSDKQSLVYLKKYLAEVKIRQNPDGYSAPRKFLSNGRTYRFDYDYPSEGARQGSIGSKCQFGIRLNADATYLYNFDLVNGKMKLIETNVIG